MNGKRMANAYGTQMATPMQRYGTVRNGTERHQDSSKSSSLSYPPKPVDKGKAVIVPSKVWGRIASIAEDRGTTVEEILVAALKEIVRPTNRHERVLQLVRAGLTDARVAERTGELKNYVANVRRQAGLKANRQPRTDTERSHT